MKDKVISLLKYYYDCVFVDSSSEAVSVFPESIFKVNDDLTSRIDKNLSNKEIEGFDLFKRKQCKNSNYWYGYTFFKVNNNNEKPCYSPIFYGIFDSENYRVEDITPKLNYQFLKSKFDLSIEEIKKIYEKLELDGEDPNLSYKDIINRLSKYDTRFEKYITRKDIYKVGAILVSESSQYTIGMEKEYKRLIKLIENDPSILFGTSLEVLFNNNTKENNEQNFDNDFLYEPFKLDRHQRRAVKSALENKITIITGPPGTGKSQVVSSIIINAILNGKNVLFASKNNKAIDVVTNRINGEFKKEYPLIFRLKGKNSEIIQCLKRINNSIYEPKKEKELKHHENNLRKAIKLNKKLMNKIGEIIISRQGFNKYLYAYEKIDGKKYLNRIIDNNNSIKKAALINSNYKRVAIYLKLLKKISREDNLEHLSEEDYNNREEICRQSNLYVKKWLEIFPSLIDIDAKKDINTYISIKEQLLKGELSFNDFITLNRQLEELMPKVVKYFRAWSVTNLSIYGRIPLVPRLFDLLIIDEATQNDIASAIPLLFRTKQAIIIGDPNQLPHISQLETKESRKFLVTKHNLKESIWNNFEYTTQSLYALWNSLFPQDVILLKDHYRSHEQIIGFSNQNWYKNQLEVCTDYRKLAAINDRQRAIDWIDVNGYVGRASKSYYNSNEIDETIKIVENLKNDNNVSIGVVTPYREQANRINTKLYKIISEEDINSKRVYVDTIHGYQGDEKDVMLFSLVVSNFNNFPAKDSKINRSKMQDRVLSFYRNQGNLINVALTRARSRLIIVGNKEFCRDSNVDLLENLLEYCENIGNDENIEGNQVFESDEENVLYKKMCECGISAIPQYKFNQYRLDFAIINHEKSLQLCIEVDGKQHAKGFSLDPEQLIKYDLIRNQRLHYYGWKVLRFWTYEIRDNIEECIKKIEKYIN